MARPKLDRRRKIKPRTRQKSTSTRYSQHQTQEAQQKILKAIMLANRIGVRQASVRHGIPKTTLQRKFNEVMGVEKENRTEKLDSKRLCLLTPEEEDAVVKYVVWGSERDINPDMKLIRSIMRDVHSIAVNSGEKRQKMNPHQWYIGQILAWLLKASPNGRSTQC